MCRVSSPSVQIVISVKLFSISFPLAVTKRWSNGECLKQAVHLALGCTCPFSAPAGPCPRLAHPLLTLWDDRRQQSQELCSIVLDGLCSGWFSISVYIFSLKTQLIDAHGVSFGGKDRFLFILQRDASVWPIFHRKPSSLSQQWVCQSECVAPVSWQCYTATLHCSASQNVTVVTKVIFLHRVTVAGCVSTVFKTNSHRTVQSLQLIK